MPTITTEGFLAAPKQTASGKTYTGRLTCRDVHWTGHDKDRFATFTLTAAEVADAAEGRLIWTDQDVQRGIQPDLDSPPPRELPLSEGYPDPSLYIFHSKNADAITEKLLEGEKQWLSPLVWNMRPGTFEAFWDDEASDLYVYTGNLYLPDSHHRQQAILKAVRLYRDAPKAFPKFSPDKQFSIELYFLSREDEGNYFFDKNQRPRPTAKSKAYDLTTLDDLSVLAKRVVDRSTSLRGNVNRVTDRLAAGNRQVATLSTLREMMRTFAPAEALDEAEMEGLERIAARFYDTLADVRPELGHLSRSDRRQVREELLVDAAVMMHGYAHLMRVFNDDAAKTGMARASKEWKRRLERLSPERVYTFGNWSGDLFQRSNPLWESIGVMKTRSDGRKTVLNTGGVRARAGRVLTELLAVDPVPEDLAKLVD